MALKPRSLLQGAVITGVLFLFGVSPALPKDIDFQFMDIDQVSRYYEDRIAFQHVEKAASPAADNSLAGLLVIKSKKLYLLKDGYDNAKDVQTRLMMMDGAQQVAGDLWVNKINSKPDYVRVTERKIEVLKNFGEEYVSKNFGSFYLSVRNAFIQKHVNVFKQLMADRRESGLVVERYPIPKPVYIGSQNEPQKFGTYVVGKTLDEKLYYAEDSDGDDVTETFYVNIPDGFSWGYKSGPNILLIYGNKNEELKSIMGSLAKWAYFGTPEEEKRVIQTFPKDSEIIGEFNLDAITPAATK